MLEGGAESQTIPPPNPKGEKTYRSNPKGEKTNRSNPKGEKQIVQILKEKKQTNRSNPKGGKQIVQILKKEKQIVQILKEKNKSRKKEIVQIFKEEKRNRLNIQRGKNKSFKSLNSTLTFWLKKYLKIRGDTPWGNKFG